MVTVNSGYSDVGAILQNGETWIWGHNLYGSLGNGTTSTSLSERNIGNDIIDIKFDGYSSYILKEDKTVWATGLNNYGQLGLGDTTTRTIYTQVMFEDGEQVTAKAIQAGAKNLQFIGTDGKVYVTGYNGNGQLSNGTKTNSLYPTKMLDKNADEVIDIILLNAGSSFSNSNPNH